jgi:uncharacterized DUF497 family protein
MQISGFDWDEGNLEKIKKKIPIEIVQNFFSTSSLKIVDDIKHSSTEMRFIAFGKYQDRDLFVVFTFRTYLGELKIRVISARYVHKKEREELYEEIKNKKENHNQKEKKRT